MNELPWDERVTMLSINPDAATREDVARMAAELVEICSKAMTHGAMELLLEGMMRRLLESDSWCPACGHNRDKSSVSSIDNDDGTRSCQMCGIDWIESVAPPASPASGEGMPPEPDYPDLCNDVGGEMWVPKRRYDELRSYVLSLREREGGVMVPRVLLADINIELWA